MGDTRNGVCEAVLGWRNCSRNIEHCTVDQVPIMNQYISDFVSVLQSKATFHAAGNGAFIYSCQTHCNCIAGAWGSYKIDGILMRDAVSKWWNSDGTDPAVKHTYMPCKYK